VSFDPALPGPGLIIGDDNIFREGFTAHRGKTQQPTRIGNGNYWMANSHVGHDAVVGNRCIIANGALLAGHVEMADRVVVGGNATIHQFVRVGEGALISGLTGMSKDLCPWFTLTAINVAGSINVIGLRRAGASPQRIDAVRWVYRTICRAGLTVPRALERLREREGDPTVAEYIAFATRSQRGVLTARGRGSDQPKTASRSGAPAGAATDAE
jgi:UDP-N-acetylglucosamine acyltransferase